jgi:hypothetical protein
MITLENSIDLPLSSLHCNLICKTHMRKAPTFASTRALLSDICHFPVARMCIGAEAVGQHSTNPPSLIEVEIGL